LVGSTTLVAITLTLAGAGATDGAKWTADNELVASVPQQEPLQPAPLKPQVTSVFEVPVTLAVKSCLPALGTEALGGVMLIGASPGRTVMVALLAFVKSVLLYRNHDCGIRGDLLRSCVKTRSQDPARG